MPTTPRPDSRRRFLKQLGGGLGLLPVTAALVRGADRQPDVGSWDAVRAQFPFEDAVVPMNAGNLCPSPMRVVRHQNALAGQIEIDVSHGHRDGFRALIEASRTQVAGHLHTDPEEIALVRNTTEANAAVGALRDRLG